MPNTQQPMSVDQVSDRLLVHSIFPTLQGEGPFVGEPAVFIRLVGCNLQCVFCDTDYTSQSKAYSIREDTEPCLFDLVREVARVTTIAHKYVTNDRKPLVVITGGEPFRQNVAPLIKELVLSGFLVQIETNGTLYQDIHPKAVVVCSPKTPRINADMARRANVFKYVLDADHVDPLDGLPEGTLGQFGRTARPPEGWQGVIYVQPCDDGVNETALNAINLQAAVDSCQRFGYRLCLQVHKIAGLA